MDPHVSTLERAFALAASGRFHKVSDIRLQLHREGYNHELVQGPVLAKQLIDAMEQAHTGLRARARKRRTSAGRPAHGQNER